MNSTIKNSLILCAITLIAGLLLGSVYEITKEPRTKQQEKLQNEAYQKVFVNAETFETYEYDNKLVNEKLKSNGITDKNVVINGVVVAYDKDNSILGYVVNVTSKEGFGGDISFSVGIDNALNITGISILSISETAGLGMNATNEDFLNQYLKNRTGMFEVNKEDSSAGTNIDAISGATITSKAVTKGVNTAILVAEVIITEVK